MAKIYLFTIFFADISKEMRVTSQIFKRFLPMSNQKIYKFDFNQRLEKMAILCFIMKIFRIGF